MMILYLATLLAVTCRYSGVTTAFSPSFLTPPIRTQSNSNSRKSPFALYSTLDQNRAALEDLMRKNLDGDDTCDLQHDQDCEVVYDDDDEHEHSVLAIFNDESNQPTPLQELQQHQHPRPHENAQRQSAFARRHPPPPQLPQAPPAAPEVQLLTTAGRRHREVEMDLIQLLLKDDADNSAVNELMHLWMYETHDSAAAKELETMEESCSPGLVQESQQLQKMINKYPTWAEPKSRLAALLYFQGQLSQSYDLCMETLRLKPWHFECLHLLVLLSLRMRDFPLALYWARRGLPPMRYRPKKRSSSDDEDHKNHPGRGKNMQHVPAADLEPICTKRRTAWVERALQMATDQWQQAEIDTARALQKRRGRKRRSTTTDDQLQQASLGGLGQEQDNNSWQ